MNEAEKILEHFSGSDLADSFHKIVSGSGTKLSARDLALGETFFFAGAQNLFELIEKAIAISSHVGVSEEEGAALFTIACKQMKREILTYGQERIVQTLLDILRKLES